MSGDSKIVLIAAIGENNVIGRNGQLPWRLKSDLKHFRDLTVGKPVIMGRKTFASIGKPLKDRTNIVLTGDLGLAAPGAVLWMLEGSIETNSRLAQYAQGAGVDAARIVWAQTRRHLHS